MSDSVDWKALYFQKEEERKQEEERRKQEEERRKQAEEINRKTTFQEFIRYCHEIFSQPLRAGDPPISTQGTIPTPSGKHCPLRLRPWTDCATIQQNIYNSVCHYLQPVGQNAPQLFTSLMGLEATGDHFAHRLISSEKDLEIYERIAVEDHVQYIISELCKIPAARDEFLLGDGLWFDNHANTLNAEDNPPPDDASASAPSVPDQFCIHRIEGGAPSLLITVEYKPPHKLSVENLRAGLRPMEFYHDIVESNEIPTDQPEKLRYNAARLAGSAVAQEYHVMIQEGLEYSYLNTGFAHVQLWIPSDDPATLYYDLCEPNMDFDACGGEVTGPVTMVWRVLCLCLMSFRTRPRDQAWRNAAQAQLPIWETNFYHVRSKIPQEELRQNPPGSDYESSERNSSQATSSDASYEPPKPSAKSATGKSRRMPTRSRPGCASPEMVHRENSSDSDMDPAVSSSNKRSHSQIVSSPSSQSSSTSQRAQKSRERQTHDNEFCTQKCLLGILHGGELDASCPNVNLHRCRKDGLHPVSANGLVHLIKQQLDKDLDHNCTPFGDCGSFGAPFKITCSAYGYTIVGKGTSAQLWKQVSQEAEIYRILHKVQGSAVPVFLGAIDLAYIYFLHGAGQIRHMLLMGWGGEKVPNMKLDKALRHAISRSVKKIRHYGVIHGDLRPENILWNKELNRALIIDFHRCTLDHRPAHKRAMSTKSKSPSKKNLLESDIENRDPKRFRAL